MNQPAALPPRGETPLAELESFMAWADRSGTPILLAFEGEMGEARFEAPEDLPAGAGERLGALATRLLDLELGDWSRERGARGYVTFGSSTVWISAVGGDREWTHERAFELADLACESWDRDPEPEFA